MENCERNIRIVIKILTLIFLFSLGPVIYFYKDSVCYKSEDCKGWRTDKYSVNEKYVEPHYCLNVVCYDGIVNFRHRDFYCNITYIKDVTQLEASVAIQNVKKTKLYRKDGLCHLSRKNILPPSYIVTLFAFYCSMVILNVLLITIAAMHTKRNNDAMFNREIIGSSPSNF